MSEATKDRVDLLACALFCFVIVATALILIAVN